MIVKTFDLREKKFADFFWTIEVPKKLNFFKKYLKKNTIHTEEFQKNYNFAPGATNHTFLTHPVYKLVVMATDKSNSFFIATYLG